MSVRRPRGVGGVGESPPDRTVSSSPGVWVSVPVPESFLPPPGFSKGILGAHGDPKFSSLPPCQERGLGHRVTVARTLGARKQGVRSPHPHSLPPPPQAACAVGEGGSACAAPMRERPFPARPRVGPPGTQRLSPRSLRSWSTCGWSARSRAGTTAATGRRRRSMWCCVSAPSRSTCSWTSSTSSTRTPGCR